MGCRGVLFALTGEQDAALAATAGDDEVMDFVEQIEEAWDEPWLCEVDKSWDAMHRCLSDGTLWLGPRTGEPLELALLGGGHHHKSEDYIVAHVLAGQVPAVAAALEGVGRQWLRERYDRIDPGDYQGVLDDDDFEYTWYYLTEVRDFYKRAAVAGRSVVFTVDQ
ncbi:hypothetical protein Ade02nite_16980 [Paractinoplanes deccanensis]|uniref:DUF1877 family protein n=1 Tax=Paractinoplanes deccanensis TaxID=113561 RepID=A0ABQ3XZF5_9ACTN|nr:YfbM family protein [Actinoplanes deccanensis]GID73057.1 hypothetical protein Ade02nite_16980 [Actinoplanes deccanensis]